MNRFDATLYTIAFAAYLGSFLGYIFHVALGKKKLGVTATWLAGLGMLPHTAAFAVRWINQGHVPLANMYEYMGLMAWMVVLCLLYFIKRYDNLKIGVFLVPVAVMLLVTASLLPSNVNRQLMPALQSTWLAIHVSLAALGSGAFLIAFATSTLFLITSPVEDRASTSLAWRKEWRLLWITWILGPAFIALILVATGLLPLQVESAAEARLLDLDGRPFTAFSIGDVSAPVLLGRWAIGFGIGMVVCAVFWPLIHRRYLPRSAQVHSGVQLFILVISSLLLAAVIVGFLIRKEVFHLTPRSYFKIFEFFGPTVIISWLLLPLMRRLLLPRHGGWVRKLDVARPALEEISYAAVAVGYPLYTVGALFAGAIWAEQAWGSWWGWDPKEVGALIIWLFYTGYLHARYHMQWKGYRAAVLVVFGMVMIFVSFFGNYFFGGLHSFEVT